jgi:hypothetical protein
MKDYNQINNSKQVVQSDYNQDDNRTYRSVFASLLIFLLAFGLFTMIANKFMVFEVYPFVFGGLFTSFIVCFVFALDYFCFPGINIFKKAGESASTTVAFFAILAAITVIGMFFGFSVISKPFDYEERDNSPRTEEFIQDSTQVREFAK